MRRLLLGFFVCCSQGAPVMNPPPMMVPDPEDVFCDPLEKIADDSATPATKTAEPLIQWVDPKIGTGGIAWGTGSTYPGAQAPFGMARPSPDTSYLGAAADFLHCAGYARDDDVIDGFSQFHLHGAGIADYGGTALMPVIGMSAGKSTPRGHGSKFSHANEKASPGYYAVVLDDTKIQVELTATPRVAMHRYTFPKSSDAVVIVDAAHVLADGNEVADASVEIDAANKEVRGFSRVLGSYSRGFGGIPMYFVARFDAPFGVSGTFAKGALSEGATSAMGKDVGAYVHFASDVVNVHIGLSLVDIAHAKMNLDAEDAPFDVAKKSTEDAWEKRLARVRIEARSDRDRKIFYTALYHTALMPTLASDVDGSYRGIDGAVHTTQGKYFTDFSLWDTYRNLHSLIAWLYPDDARDLSQSLVLMGNDAGFLPRWPIGTGESGGMIGDGATIALADAWARGVRGWDAQTGYAIAKKQATVKSDKGVRGGLEEWMSLGYIANESGGGSVSKTLELAAADDALGTWASAMNDPQSSDLFHGRAKKAWTSLYDPKSRFFVPKMRDGSIVEINPLSIGGPYTEGSAWQYSFMLPFDIAGLETAMTRPVFLSRLEQLFTRAACTGKAAFLPQPYYWASNEPDLIAGWLFGAVGDREREGRWLRWTSLTHYGDVPDGLPGNDDGGTMSAFYVFAALGLYPIPGTDLYILGAPLFPKATIGSFVIDAPGASKKTFNVISVKKNDTPLASTIRQSELDGTIVFSMK